MQKHTLFGRPALVITHLLFGGTLIVTPVNGQAATPSASEGGLEEIVVTARKREESLSQVPVAVSAVSASDINRYASTDLAKIGQLVPQVMLAQTGGGGSGAIFAIRGISTASQDQGLASTVAINIDGTQVSRGRIITQGFFDLDQVEILKGPQALFFGKNSPGGVISLKSAGATSTFQSYVRAGYELEAQERYAEGALSGPITDTLGYRVALRYSGMEGYLHDTGGPYTLASDPNYPHPGPGHSNSPDLEEYLGRVTLDWHPSDSFKGVLKLFASHVDDYTGPDSTSEIKCANPTAKPISVDFSNGSANADPYGDCKIDGNRSSTSLNPTRVAQFINGAGDGVPYLHYSSVLTSLNLEYTADDLTFTSITSWYHLRTNYFDNFDFTAVGVTFTFNALRNTVFSQELRAVSAFDGPLNFTAGVYYENEKLPLRGDVQLLNIAAFNGTGLDPISGLYGDWTLFEDQHNDTLSTFGQIRYNIVPTVEISAGARWTSERSLASYGDVYTNAITQTFGIFKPAGETIGGHSKDSNVSPEATVAWHPTKRSTIYAAYKTGFKAGGFSQPSVLTPGFTGDTLRFKSEKAKGFEVGAKGELLDGKLRASITGYYYKFEDLQVQTFDPATISYEVGNAASSKTTGVEVELQHAATEHLQFRGGVGYNKAYYADYPNAPCYAGQTLGCNSVVLNGAPTQSQDLAGRTLARAPKVTESVGASYEMPVKAGLRMSISSDLRYTSSYLTQENLNPVGYQGGFVLVDASARLTTADGAWEFALIGRNLSNEHYITSSIDKPFGPPEQVAAFVGRTREVILQATYRH